VISLQSPAQLENIYGREVSKIIIGNTATKIIFRERDPEIAERISKAFGEREVIEIQEGISYGAHEARDGVNLSMQNKIRPVVSVSQILELPVNTAYVKLADKTAVAQVKFLIANP
jgi:type IV secretory pathway TraG/TraD family ATPase VirD4